MFDKDPSVSGIMRLSEIHSPTPIFIYFTLEDCELLQHSTENPFRQSFQVEVLIWNWGLFLYIHSGCWAHLTVFLSLCLSTSQSLFFLSPLPSTSGNTNYGNNKGGQENCRNISEIRCSLSAVTIMHYMSLYTFRKSILTILRNVSIYSVCVWRPPRHVGN